MIENRPVGVEKRPVSRPFWRRSESRKKEVTAEGLLSVVECRG